MNRRQFLAAAGGLATVGAVGGVGYRRRQYEVTATATRFDWGLRLNELGAERRSSTVELDSFDPPVRARLRRAAAVRGVGGVNDLPAAAADRLREASYLRIDGRNYTTYVSDLRDVPLAIDAAVVEPSRAPFDPARIEFVARNGGDERLELADGPPMPFGVVSAHRPDDRGARTTLWSDDYRGADGVTTVGRRVVAVTGLGVETTLDPGETASTVYQLGRGGPGRWVVEESVVARRAGESGHGDFPYRVELDARRRRE